MVKDINKIILLVGLMGSGKTSVGKRLAQRLNLPFVDGDREIEKAAGKKRLNLGCLLVSGLCCHAYQNCGV